MTKLRWRGWVLVVLLANLVRADPAGESSAPTADRIGFPSNYAQTYRVLRIVDRKNELKVVTVFGNELAASVTRTNQLPYPDGSILVMETARAVVDSGGKPLLDEQGHFRRGEVLGLHVMKRGRGFGEAYREKRSGEWEFVEYKSDGSYLTPPARSFVCAECHIKAGAQRDFVYHGKLAAEAGP